MKSTIFLACLTLIGFLKTAISQECMTPTQVAGTCIDIKDCQPLRELLRREDAKGSDFAKEFICHYEGKNPIVCCPGKPGMKMRKNLYGPLLPPQCGFSNVSHTRIVGGVPAKLNNIHPICLPVGRIRHLDFVNTHPFLAGWGALNFNELRSNDLMEVQVSVITNQDCAKTYPIANDNNKLICTSGAEGKDSCKGDSGGPVMLPINGSYYEIGVIAGGRPCGFLPARNTRVTSVLQFIISNLQ